MNNKIAFYRKYRPNCFLEIVGQNYITKTLQNSILQQRLSHAYIFSGPRGVGKTSIAKIFSKAINCLNNNNGDCCNQCYNCNLINNNQTTDIVELDAASNNGVNEVRNIIDTIGYVPNTLKRKVYIIDEAHMLSNAAWNAFLKSIEDPPKYLTFVFATTEPHKFPVTIVSRCQRYNFLKLNNLELKEHLTLIAKKENITIDNEALNKLVMLSDGSLRDACSILDQLDSYTNSNITINDVNEVFGLVDISEKLLLIKNIKSNQIDDLIRQINNYENIGADFYQLALDLVEILYDKLVYLKTKKLSLLKNLPEINVDFVDLAESEIICMLKVWQNNLLDIKNTNNQKFFFRLATLDCTKCLQTETQIINNNQNLDIKNTIVNNEYLEPKKEVQENKKTVTKEAEKEVKIEQKKEISSDEISRELIDSSIKNSISSKHIGVLELKKIFNPNAKDEEALNNVNFENKEKENQVELDLFNASSGNKTSNFIIDNFSEIEEEKEQIEKEVKKTKKQKVNKKIKIDSNEMLQVIVHKNNEMSLKVQELFDSIKSKPPTNLIEANIIDIKKIIAVSENGILVLAKDKINATTLNSLQKDKALLDFLKIKLNKIFKLMAICKEELDEFVNNKPSNISKANIKDINIDDLLEIVNNKKTLVKDIAEEMIFDLIEEE